MGKDDEEELNLSNFGVRKSKLKAYQNLSTNKLLPLLKKKNSSSKRKQLNDNTSDDDEYIEEEENNKKSKSRKTSSTKKPKKSSSSSTKTKSTNNSKKSKKSEIEEITSAQNLPKLKGFEPILENEFLGSTTIFHLKHLKEDDIIMCNCGPNYSKSNNNKDYAGDDHCGNLCVNRILCMECIIGHCPCHDKCTNNNFQKRSWAKVCVKQSGEKGYGLFSKEDIIPKGKFIIEYVGEVIDEKIYKQRQSEYDGERHYYFLSIAPNQIIDASRKGNVARFINHSCEPNAVLQKWTIGHQSRIGVFALRDIEKDEEITFDYAFECYGVSFQKCYCGSKNCRGTITSKDSSLLLLDGSNGSSQLTSEEEEKLRLKNQRKQQAQYSRVRKQRLEARSKQRIYYALKLLNEGNDNTIIPKEVIEASKYGNVLLIRNFRKVQRKRLRQFHEMERQLVEHYKKQQESEKDEFGLTEYERKQMTMLYERIQKGESTDNLNLRSLSLQRRCKATSYKEKSSDDEEEKKGRKRRTTRSSTSTSSVSTTKKKKESSSASDKKTKKKTVSTAPRTSKRGKKKEYVSDSEEEEIEEDIEDDIQFDEESEGEQKKEKKEKNSKKRTSGTRRKVIKEKEEEEEEKESKKKSTTKKKTTNPTSTEKANNSTSTTEKKKAGRKKKEVVESTELDSTTPSKKKKKEAKTNESNKDNNHNSNNGNDELDEATLNLIKGLGVRTSKLKAYQLFNANSNPKVETTNSEPKKRGRKKKTE
ncbi:hypothetical protein ABK040_016841 [Willaertia magna]